jgi:NTP pyrophosphatase (non-canonical NTP hydrolase)
MIELFYRHFEDVVSKTWNFSGRLTTPNDHFSNAAMGLSSEAGEAADVVKKMLYHSEKPWTFFREKLILELGDVLYYALVLMDLFQISWEEVVTKNRQKLESRHPELGKVTERYGPSAIK